MAKKKSTKRMNAREGMKEALRKRMKESNERTTGGTGFFKSGKGINFWKCDQGGHLLDIIPYTAGSNDPHVKEGEFAYVLDLYVHYSVGVDEKGVFVCPTMNYNKPCPICEHRKQLQAEGADDETLKALKPKRRCIYNIVCYDSSGEEAKGIQVWSVAHWFSEYHFQALAKKPSRSGAVVGEPFIYYMDSEEGKTIGFSKEGQGIQTKFLGHRFIDREGYEISDEILDKAYCLDEIINIESYEKIYEAYYGEPIEDEETKKPKKTKKANKIKEEEIEDYEDNEVEEDNDEVEEDEDNDETGDEVEDEENNDEDEEDVILKEEDLESMDFNDLIKFIKQEKLSIEDPEDLDDEELLDAIWNELDDKIQKKKKETKKKSKKTSTRRRRK